MPSVFLRAAQSGLLITAVAGYVLTANADGTWSGQPGGGGGAVTSVFGRVGIVTAQVGDYDSDLVDNVSGVPGVSVSDALDYLQAHAGAVASVFGRVGIVTAQPGDYNSDEVDNASGVAGLVVSDALDNLATGITALSGEVSPAFTTGALAKGNGTGLVALSGAAVSDVVAWSGTEWVSTTLVPIFNIPTNPGDNGKIPIVSGGNFTYTAGSAGQALIYTGSTWAAGTDFGGLQLTTTGSYRVNTDTGFLQVGLNSGSGAGSAASVGRIRLAAGAQCFVRQGPDTGNYRIFEDVSGTLTLGSQSGTGANTGVDVNCASGLFSVTVGTLGMSISTGSVKFQRDIIGPEQTIVNPVFGPIARTSGASTTVKWQGQNTSVASQAAGRSILQGGSSTVTTTGARQAGAAIMQGGSVTGAGGTPKAGNCGILFGTTAEPKTGNLAIGADPDGPAYGGGQGAMYMADAVANPTTGSSGGFLMYSNGAGKPGFVTAAGNILIFDVLTTASATAGGVVAIPATCQEFMTITFLGNTRKIALFAA